MRSAAAPMSGDCWPTNSSARSVASSHLCPCRRIGGRRGCPRSCHLSAGTAALRQSGCPPRWAGCTIPRTGGEFVAAAHVLLASDRAVELAVPLSVAVRIEPDLIRAIRLGVLPYLDVAAESDLWFSDLVASRGPDSII